MVTFCYNHPRRKVYIREVMVPGNFKVSILSSITEGSVVSYPIPPMSNWFFPFFNGDSSKQILTTL